MCGCVRRETAGEAGRGQPASYSRCNPCIGTILVSNLPISCSCARFAGRIAIQELPALLHGLRLHHGANDMCAAEAVSTVPARAGNRRISPNAPRTPAVRLRAMAAPWAQPPHGKSDSPEPAPENAGAAWARPCARSLPGDRKQLRSQTARGRKGQGWSRRRKCGLRGRLETALSIYPPSIPDAFSRRVVG